MKSFKEKLNINKIPRHIAIIMDGNGRWAAKHGNERIFGHEHGVDAVRSTVEGAGEIGVEYLTLYAFSTENWDRPQNEVDALMGLLVQAIENETGELMKNNVKLAAIGDLGKLPENVADTLNDCIKLLENNTGLTLVLALSYSSKWEIINAVKNIANDAINEKIHTKDIDDKLFESYLSTAHLPDPELLIRTSGEYRISNFLLWQIAYSELYFTNKLWPDFRKEDLFEAVYDFQNRERRFGKISEQLFS
ncbi:undecaprenyl diphosphate synthase [Mariniphaga anaerophila]|uniref:Isoprenyl transferase n=1 Tax=Mariniphaga anaerophila TaxID=1484053 RepID=A0A1M5AGK1_9BACT|nr:isoprenyl transferase [Mariniphaga anaerophila]SHF29265.1 undecaprenyl diphosphate synthase [Mariniphaga anaerophila]